MNSMTLMPVASVAPIEAVRARAPYAGLAAVKPCIAPVVTRPAAHGTTVPNADFRLAGAAATQDVPGSPPREAPV